VAVLDSNGAVVPTSSIAIRVRIVAGTGTVRAHLRGVTDMYADSGVATFPTINLDSAGTGYQLVASAPGLPDTVSAPFDIVPAPPARMAFVVQPSGTLAGALVSPGVRVVVLDSLNNIVSSSSATITIAIDSNPVAGVLSGTTVRNAASGAASFTDLSLNKSGDRYRLMATSPGLPAVSSLPFGVFRPVSRIATFYGATCVLTSTGAAYCGSSGVPTLVPGGLTFTSIDLGASACGLTTSGAAYCWGIGGPLVIVSSTLTFTALTVGGAHACGLTASGSAYCWGDDFYGELGNGTRNFGQSTPDSVRGGLVFASISAGDYHTCGITTSGATYCWGRNAFGQLGNGTRADTTLPVAVSGGLVFTSLASGENGMCAQTASADTYCWGTAGRQSGSGANPATPVAVAGGTGLTAITTGDSHACGLTAGGSAYCWGNAQYGELGNGLSAFDWTATPVAVAGNLTITTVSAGGDRTCAVTVVGEAYCWGDYPVSLLGDGRTADTSRPQPVRIF
jgi:hypothetical protein